MGALFPLLLPVFQSLISRLIPDKAEQAKAEAELQAVINQAQIEAYKAQAVQDAAKKDIITTEIGQNNWASNWRAYLMMVCISIVAYNWVIVSLLNAFLVHINSPILPVPVPPELWTLVTLGLGGYIGKETMSNYTQAKYGQPDDKKFFDILRNKIFKSGMSQDQVEALTEALKARDSDS